MEPQQRASYQAMIDRAVWTPAGDRTFLEVRGADRATFLHNLCTQEIRKREPGSGAEAFFTNVKGKLLGHVVVAVGADSIVIDTVPGQGPVLLPHLDKYHIREHVELIDQSATWKSVWIVGPTAESVLRELGVAIPTPEEWAHCESSLAGFPVVVSRMAWLNVAAFGLRYRAVDEEATEKAIGQSSAIRVSPTILEIARIEAGLPLFGRDIHDDLPQEVGRDRQAISFTKGCYLGQETVARIDALGQVHRALVGFQFEGTEMPESGIELRVAEEVVAHATSVCYSPRVNAPLGLGYARRELIQQRPVLACVAGNVRIVDLPLA